MVLNLVIFYNPHDYFGVSQRSNFTQWKSIPSKYSRLQKVPTGEKHNIPPWCSFGVIQDCAIHKNGKLFHSLPELETQECLCGENATRSSIDIGVSIKWVEFRVNYSFKVPANRWPFKISGRSKVGLLFGKSWRYSDYSRLDIISAVALLCFIQTPSLLSVLVFSDANPLTSCRRLISC